MSVWRRLICQELYIVCSWDWDEGRCSIYCKGVRYVLRLLGFQLQVTTWRRKSGDKRLTSTRLFGKICQLDTHSAQIKEQLDKYNTHGIDRIDRSFDWVDEWMGPRLKRKSIQAPPRVFLSVLPVCSCLLKKPEKMSIVYWSTGFRSRYRMSFHPFAMCFFFLLMSMQL